MLIKWRGKDNQHGTSTLQAYCCDMSLLSVYSAIGKRPLHYVTILGLVALFIFFTSTSKLANNELRGTQLKAYTQAGRLRQGSPYKTGPELL
jgi:hypothetical protein